jgi:hypothetical protein
MFRPLVWGIDLDSKQGLMEQPADELSTSIVRLIEVHNREECELDQHKSVCCGSCSSQFPWTRISQFVVGRNFPRVCCLCA